MKIKKLWESKQLITEADTLDPANTSVNDMAAAMQNATDNSIPDKVAKDLAVETKNVGQKIGADTVVIDPGATTEEEEKMEFKNKLTTALDDALRANRSFKRRHVNEVANVLVSGLPGSSKTANIKQWARNNNINIFEVNAKQKDLDAFINGFPSIDPDNPGFIKNLASSSLAPLNKPNSVLFLDEFNRQVDASIRGSLLQLINEHEIYDANAVGGKYHFDNLLFTIVAINPFDELHDPGATALNDAEKSRFLYTIMDFDSNTEITSEFLRIKTEKRLKEYAKIGIQNWDEETKEDVEATMRVDDLGQFIVRDRNFKYDTKDKLEALYTDAKKMLNQRALTEGLEAAGGDVAVFKRWLTEASNFLQEDIDMILTILDSYDVPTYQELLTKYASILNISGTDATNAVAATAGVTAANNNTNNDLADDEEVVSKEDSILNRQSVKQSISAEDIKFKITDLFRNNGW